VGDVDNGEEGYRLALYFPTNFDENEPESAIKKYKIKNPGSGSRL
jgi:hypothetical protein